MQDKIPEMEDFEDITISELVIPLLLKQLCGMEVDQWFRNCGQVSSPSFRKSQNMFLRNVLNFHFFQKIDLFAEFFSYGEALWFAGKHIGSTFLRHHCRMPESLLPVSAHLDFANDNSEVLWFSTEVFAIYTILTQEVLTTRNTGRPTWCEQKVFHEVCN